MCYYLDSARAIDQYMPKSENVTSATPVYLDEKEKTKLKQLAEVWGCSMSAAVKRLLREKKIPQE